MAAGQASKKAAQSKTSKPSESKLTLPGKRFRHEKAPQKRVILAMDPGRKNFAWAVRKGTVEQVGWIEPIVDVTDDLAFCNDYIELLIRFKPDFVVLERFMVRRGGQSMLAESLNQMIGRLVILTRIYAGVELIQVTSASWKNWWRKNRGEEAWHEQYAHVSSIHQRDACGISEYIDEHWITKNL